MVPKATVNSTKGGNSNLSNIFLCQLKSWDITASLKFFTGNIRETPFAFLITAYAWRHGPKCNPAMIDPLIS